MNKKFKLSIAVAILVMLMVVAFDQLIPTWPTFAVYLGVITLYPVYLIKYLAAFLIGAFIYYKALEAYEYEARFYDWMDFTFFSLMFSWPLLVLVVSSVAQAPLTAIMLTDIFSLLITFYPTGLILAITSEKKISPEKKEPEEEERILGINKQEGLIIQFLINLIPGIIVFIIEVMFGQFMIF